MAWEQVRLDSSQQVGSGGLRRQGSGKEVGDRAALPLCVPRGGESGAHRMTALRPWPRLCRRLRVGALGSPTCSLSLLPSSWK